MPAAFPPRRAQHAGHATRVVRRPRTGRLLSAALLLGLVLAVLVGVPTARAAEDPCASGLVDRIQRTYQALKSFQAHFTQEDVQADGTRRAAKGSVSYLKPGRMRWEYAPPNQQLLVTDGTTVWLYDPILDNVTVQALSDLTAGTPLAFLLGAGNLDRDFTCRAFTRPPPHDGLAYVELLPKKHIPTLAYLQLGAQPHSGQIAALRMIDAQGNLREVRFRDLHTNVPLPAASFTFKITKGMEVIRKNQD